MAAPRVRRLSENSESHRIRWQLLLKNWPLTELQDVMNTNPVVLDASTSPEAALQILLDNNIRGAPVRDANGWIGVFDLREAIKFAIKDYEDNNPPENPGVVERAMEFFTRSPLITTNTLSYLARVRPFHLVRMSATAFEVAQVLAQGAHIIGIEDDSGALVAVITQGSLFRAFADRWEIGESLVPLGVLADLGLVTSPVRTIPTTMQALEAFKLMANWNLSGLAVVDSTGMLVHNTSATDIKMWLQRESSLTLSIEDFLKAIRQQDITETRALVCTCTMDVPLKRAVGKLRATRYHRLWVIDENSQPIGVLALTDIFKFLTSETLGQPSA